MTAPPRNSAYRWVSLQPPILVHALSPRFEEFNWDLPCDSIHRLVSFSWPMPPHKIVEAYSVLKRSRPKDVIHWLCNTLRVANAVRQAGVSHVHFVSRYAWLDDGPFVPQHIDKLYEAIYVARMHAMKRHELAANVDSCLFVGGETDWDVPGRQTEVARLCPKATLVGDTPHSAVPQLICSAKVGLCLSSAEATQRAFAEYQLCGLPVVSTAMSGGRNELFDVEFGRLVAAERSSVAAAVKELAASQFDPYEIRAACLAKINQFRDRLCGVVQQIWDSEGLWRDFRRTFFGNSQAFRLRPPQDLHRAASEDVPWQSASWRHEGEARPLARAEA